ncbi:MAG: hypothetical protein HFF29_05615 [Oscillospiraceae bacterium]|nr:hypothetical protein [Oscillospiraceae bacterium]
MYGTPFCRMCLHPTPPPEKSQGPGAKKGLDRQESRCAPTVPGLDRDWGLFLIGVVIDLIILLFLIGVVIDLIILLFRPDPYYV